MRYRIRVMEGDPLDPVTALKALLAVDPDAEPAKQDEPAERNPREDEDKSG